MAGKPIFEVLSAGLISSASSKYEVGELLGCGTFGVVTQCKKLTTNETVALKIIRSRRSIEEAKKEEATLKMMKEFYSDTFFIVQLNESFTYEGYYCLEFEKLDISLHEFLQQRPLQLKEIRPIVQQLATALAFLKVIGISHADLKPENIMMVDHIGKPLQVKVIDFGLACDDPEEMRGMTLQTLWYRAPEILLGAPFSEEIDIWSLGCIAAEMFIGRPLFPGNNEYDMVRHIVHTIGNPPDDLLDAGMHTELFFNVEDHDPRPRTLLLSLQVEDFSSAPRTLNRLDDLMKASGDASGKEADVFDYDLVSFVDLLKQMLTVDVRERITPVHALQHPFISMKHLTSTFNGSLYVKSCVDLVNACGNLGADDWNDESQMTSNKCLAEETFSNTGTPAKFNLNKDNSTDFFLGANVITGENSSKKRKRDAPDDADAAADDECGNCPETCRAKRGRTLCSALVSGQTSPPQSALHKRKWGEDDDLCTVSADSPPAKRKSSINLNREVSYSVKEGLSSSDRAQYSSPETDYIKKRKRHYEEASDSVTSSGEKRRRGSLDGGVWWS